ncbi:MAG TPA: phospholipid carrier-dependent glycosyltransferase [Pyrinomonadaceae bacterium]|nr:phospholipid carrier-dependent glycosyltransferase [Pyrinomonadaceae bacterium]
MRRPSNQTVLWLALVLVSGIPRILGAFLLPNAFGDAYVYIRTIGELSLKLSTKTFAITDLYGFWLPLYQFISAVINVFVGNGFYTGKVVSAVFGIGSCVLVYQITLRLTANRAAALLGFALIALNPLHIFYSASAMTDVPHAFFVLASLYFALRRGWILAAIFAALAGLTRVESWMFLALVPLIQFAWDRRISFVALVILLVPPLSWFYISWKATGDWLACFKARQQYHDWLLAMNPPLAHFSLAAVLKDGATLLISTDIAVLIAAFVAGRLVVRGLPDLLTRRDRTEDIQPILAPVIFFFAFLALLSVAYITHQQPIIFPRYGLILFSLGIPILAWCFLTLKRQKPRWARTLLISIIVICVFDWSVQFAGAVGSLNQYRAHRAVADYLRDHYQPTAGTRIFSDEGTVTVLSGIGEEKFLTSSDAPKDRKSFLAFLKEKNVEYLVFISKVDSTPAKLFPDLEHGDGIGTFIPVMNSHSKFMRANIWLYRVRPVSEARP